ncbi:LysM peptidoglycan-binding domain-containing M23 family metallopeptidase [Streptomyces sp. DSM 44915]|uniref:LysM peptidoglycan-binding domain-containing M23 family metallopeptidase n=1 Tax=Streptomyces chisholmiae TaxID=3075540 RepID=A0ABU2JZK5_9ACTN|nr:LysM peptidoglycan-binding domain-containing M23 family metallopeptidase [Streptomyces sp. DSM 44915]MDT0270417.1 LysM peptidoglycan-binding domain-containing M23 family metallopeptidase [Streptomyces sp. DSM 44915]
MSGRGRHRRQPIRRLPRAAALLTVGAAGLGLPLVAAGTAGAAPASYTVAGGDTLYRIAVDHEVEGGWEQLYEANREVIGDDPTRITPGLELSLDVEGAAAPAAAVAESAEAAESADYVAPVSGVSGGGYGNAGALWSSGYHTGADFPVGTGTQVVSIAAGEVVTAGSGGSYGNEVVVRHADGHYSQYAHLSSIGVSVGQSVGAGDQLGLSGATGNVTGPHLHFEVRTGPAYGSDIDPMAYLRSHGVSI